MKNKKPNMKKSKEYPETHQHGTISIENSFFDLTKSHFVATGDLGVQIARDGRVWICINGVAFLRFQPDLKKGGESYGG